MTSPSPLLKLCWWEVDELIEHLRSRPDIWTQSSDNEQLWLREDKDGSAFGLLFIAPPDPTSPFRMFVLQTIELGWNTSYIDDYLLWLVNHWTSYRRRTVVTSFLEKELNVPHADAPLAAIAIEGLGWEEDETPEPIVRFPIQEELWPELAPPPQLSFADDPTLVGTYLLAGNTGWFQLRLVGGLLRITLNMRSRNGTVTLPLQGLIRPMNGRVREAAALLAGWPVAFDEASPVTEEQVEFLESQKPSTLPGISTNDEVIEVTPELLAVLEERTTVTGPESRCLFEDETCRGPVLPGSGCCEGHSGLKESPREE